MPEGACPDILLLNANTDTAMTTRMVAAARRLHDGCRGATMANGATYISDMATLGKAASAIQRRAGHLVAEKRPDALVVACFGDPGVHALRSELSCPVVGMAEASCHLACQKGGKFGIVSGGRAWGPILQRFVAEIGLASRLSGIHTIDPTGDAIARDRAAARAEVHRAVVEAAACGADVVVIGGAGLIGFADELRDEFAVPLLDSLDCSVSQALALALLERHASRQCR
nr:aspartate/glutamate racemase family protein [Rhodovulum sp. 12E13]